MTKLKKIRFICPAHEKKEFAGSHALYSISLGNSLEEGVNAISTLLKIKESFKHCTVLLADTLQRYRHFPDNYNSRLAREFTSNAGDAWIKKNIQKAHLNECGFFSFKRWDDYLKHPGFIEKLSYIKSLYQNDSTFRQSVETSVHEFKMRGNVQVSESTYQYLFEECAVLLLLAEDGYDFEIYPSKRIPAMAYIYNEKIKPSLIHVLRPISLEIRSRKAPVFPRLNSFFYEGCGKVA